MNGIRSSLLRLTTKHMGDTQVGFILSVVACRVKDDGGL